MNPNWVRTKNKDFFRFKCRRCGLWKNVMARTKKKSFINGYCRTACMRMDTKTTFYDSDKWRSLRYEVLKRSKKICSLCGGFGGRLHVDHIKPRSKYPELELDINNLQVLCEICNMGKSNTDETDWRSK